MEVVRMCVYFIICANQLIKGLQLFQAKYKYFLNIYHRPIQENSYHLSSKIVITQLIAILLNKLSFLNNIVITQQIVIIQKTCQY